MSGKKSQSKPVTEADEEKTAVQGENSGKRCGKGTAKRGAKQARSEAEISSDKPADSKKSTAKHTVSAEKQEKKEQPSSKTPQVMKLVQPHGDVVNPVIIAGKSSIPKHLRGIEPLSRIMRREAAEVMGEDITELTEPEEQVTVNLTELVIAANAAEILRRFNACDCEKCVAELSRLVSEKVPSRFVKLSRSTLEKGSAELDEQKEPLKKAVLSQMIRELLGNKRRSFHDE